MPVIRVEMFAGRTREQKKGLAKALTQAFTQEANGRPEDVHIIFVDVAKDDWSVAGELVGSREQSKPNQ